MGLPILRTRRFGDGISLRNMAILKRVTSTRQWTNSNWNPISNDSYIHCVPQLNVLNSNNSHFNSILVYNNNSIIYTFLLNFRTKIQLKKKALWGQNERISTLKPAYTLHYRVLIFAFPLALLNSVSLA
jgi:hypothetical protein